MFKGAEIEADDPKTGERTLLFNPRRHAWHEHFAYDPESGLLRSETPIGRATIDRLKMNTDWQIAARKYWSRDGKFPG